MAFVVGEIAAPITADPSQFNKVMDDIQQKGAAVSKNIGLQWDNISKKMETVGKSLTKYVTAPIAGAGVAAAKFAIDYESAFAGVRKTTDATEEELSALSKGIREMALELPASAVTIAGVAEAAGQLGIQTDAILGFTRTMIDLGESSNMSADQAATALARLANITQMPQDQFDRLGSTVVALGNSLATTESEIVDMALGLAGAGKQVGMTEAEILSFAGALSSVGIEAQAGGSSFSRLMVQMQLAVETGSDALDDFAAVAGMSAAQFEQAFKDDAAGAIIAFINGLGTAEQRGLSAIKVLDDMGITEVRLRDALLRASGAGDLFSQSIANGTKAWEENTALANEAAQRYATTASQLAILKNNIIEVAMQLGEVMLPYIQQATDWLRGLIQRFQELSPQQKENIVKWGLIVAAIGPMLIIGAKLIALIKDIIKVKAYLTTTAIPKLIGALQALWATMMANPILAIIAAIGLLVAAGIWLYNNWDEVKIKLQATWELIQASAEAVSIRIQQAWWDMQRRIAEAVVAILNAVAPLIEWLPDSISGGFKQMREAVESQLGMIEGRLENLSGRAEENSKRMQDALNGIVQAAQKTREAIEYIPEIHGYDTSGATRLGKGQRASTPLEYTAGVGWHSAMSFQGGGIVPGPLGAPVPAIVHGGEYIYDPAAGRAAFGGGRQTANIVIELDGRTIARAIGQPLVDEIRVRSGVRL